MKSSGDRPAGCDSQRRLVYEQHTREHLGALWRTAFRMTGSRDVADDLTQEACLKAYCAFDQYEPGTNYKAWIFRILTNLCRDWLRREARAPFKPWDNEEVGAAVASSGDNRDQPDADLQHKEFYSHAMVAMAALPPDIRLIVCLSLLEGLTYQEIAQAANIPVGTVRSRLSRGRGQLQKLLSAHENSSATIAPVSSLRRKSTGDVAAGRLVLVHNSSSEI